MRRRDPSTFEAEGLLRRRPAQIFGCAALASVLFAAASAPSSAEPKRIDAGSIRVLHTKDTVSILDRPAEDDAIAGARLGIEDNNTTGRFLDQAFTIEDHVLTPGEDPWTAVENFAARGILLILVDLPAASLEKIADPARIAGINLFNIGAPDDFLREEKCRRNLVHVAPSRSMLADGLAQYLVWKQWKRWLLIKGSHEADEKLAEAYRHAAKKFGAKIVEERTYEDLGGGRRSDSGSVQTQRLVPALTQNAPAYDVLVAADESEVFANYLPYRTYDPRPVAGAAGLKPTNWDASHEQWGAIQLQNRFTARFRRPMNERDYSAWVALRMIGEAATRTGSNDPKVIADYLKAPDFSIAAFKGVKLTLRPWNLQLRQPILLGDGRMIVSVSPQDGFLHQTSVLDTLGLDRPETRCKLD
jgi:ABC transporter substrate binding protein (PQQ-dependent alcohol dehydrogenase system)